MKTPLEREAGRLAHEREERRARADLREVLATEAGFRVFLRLLRELGADAPMTGESEMRLRNAADWMLNRAAAAHPSACVRIMAALRGIGLPPAGGGAEGDPDRWGRESLAQGCPRVENMQ